MSKRISGVTAPSYRATPFVLLVMIALCANIGNAALANPGRVPSGPGSFAAGSNFSCAITEMATVKCWGNNSKGQLGDGTLNFSQQPVTVNGLSGAVKVSAGFRHAWAILGDGSVRCWGSGFLGQLGNGFFEDSMSPVPVSGLTDAVAISTR